MMERTIVDRREPHFLKIFYTWEEKVNQKKLNRVSYPEYTDIKNFFLYGRCPNCKKRHDVYYARITKSGFLYLSSDVCGYEFNFSSGGLNSLIKEYITKTRITSRTKINNTVSVDLEELSTIAANTITNYVINNDTANTITNYTINNDTVNTNNIIGGKKNMNINGLIKGMEFGFVKGDKFKLSPLGLAFKNNENGYSVYDAKKSEMTDVTGMTFDIANAVMAMPTSIKKIVENDIIMHSNAYVVVKEIKENSLVVVSPFTSEIKEIIPIKNILGFNFYTKLTPLFDMSGVKADEDNPFGSMMPMLLMSQMGGQANGQMNPMMMMAMMDIGKKDKDGENKEDSFMSKEMMMMMALSNSNGTGINGTGTNDMLSTMMIMQMFK